MRKPLMTWLVCYETGSGVRKSEKMVAALYPKRYYEGAIASHPAKRA